MAQIAIFFFAAFVGVFTANALCDLEIMEYAPNLVHEHSNESGSNHHNNENNHHQHFPNSSSETNQEDSCCDNIASQLEASLFSKIIKNTVVGAKYFLCGNISISSQLVSFYKTANIIYHEYDTPPPLTGVNLRILIQSFLN